MSPISRTSKIVLRIILPVVVFVTFIGLYAYNTAFTPNFTAHSGDQFLLKIREGAVLQDAVDSLKNGGEFDADKFNKTTHIITATIHPGMYRIPNGISNINLIRLLRNGIQTPVRLTYNNIRTKEQLASKMSHALMCDSAELVMLMNDSNYLVNYGFNSQTSICNFIPNTYEVYWNTNANGLFEKMNREYKRFWNESRLEKANELGLSPVEVSTLASIVEEESNVKSELPVIAGLYLNRLRMGMALQADPTIKFALGNFEMKRILSKQLEFNSPYNTYMYAGLPPGPIRMASPTGIDAVLNRKKHIYLYMCAKETLNGSHNFASTLSEHNRNARKYRRALNTLRIFK